MSGTTWVEIVFMMLVLKLPIVYVCLVVWWAVRSTDDRPLEGATLPVAPAAPPRGAGQRAPRFPRAPRPHGAPVRTYPRTAAARARAER